MLRTPSVVARALHPLPMRLGAVTLYPPTLGHLVTIERVLAGVDDPVRVAFILSAPHRDTACRAATEISAAAERWAANLDVSVRAFLPVLISSLFAAAYEPSAKLDPPKAEGDLWETIRGEDDNGLGTILNHVAELIEARLVADYAAALDTPVATAIVLCIAHRIRNGYAWRDPDYVTLDRLDADENSTRDPACSREPVRSREPVCSREPARGPSSTEPPHA